MYNENCEMGMCATPICIHLIHECQVQKFFRVCGHKLFKIYKGGCRPICSNNRRVISFDFTDMNRSPNMSIS